MPALISAGYRTRYGVPQDYRQALQLYTQAAQEYRDFETGQQHAGHPMAQNNLLLYRDGKGTKPDAFTAVKWFRKSAEASNHHAHHNLGIMFERGLGVKPDIRKALEHYEQALNAGNVYSMNAVAWLLRRENPSRATRNWPLNIIRR